MTSWLDRLRVALILSPAFLLWHVWILANSNGYLLQKYGMVLLTVLMAVSSVAEAYVIVLAMSEAIRLWRGK